MNCDEFVELLTAFLDRALPKADEARFIAHLAECGGCEIYLEQFRQTIDTLGELPATSLSPQAQDRLLAASRGFRRG